MKAEQLRREIFMLVQDAQKAGQKDDPSAHATTEAILLLLRQEHFDLRVKLTNAKILLGDLLAEFNESYFAE